MSWCRGIFFPMVCIPMKSTTSSCDRIHIFRRSWTVNTVLLIDGMKVSDLLKNCKTIFFSSSLHKWIFHVAWDCLVVRKINCVNIILPSAIFGSISFFCGTKLVDRWNYMGYLFCCFQKLLDCSFIIYVAFYSRRKVRIFTCLLSIKWH